MTETIAITATDRWRATWPGGAVGVLALRGTANLARHPALEERKRALEADLRARYGGMARPELRATPVLAAYHEYYRRYDKTYHVQLQLESVALKDKPLPAVATLVETLFMAELDSGLLIAVHDLASVHPPLRIDAATGDERYTLANGSETTLKPRDMLMADSEGVICTILAGQDQRTRVSPTTRDALFVIYAPPGIDHPLVDGCLGQLAELATLVEPATRVELRRVIVAGPAETALSS